MVGTIVRILNTTDQDEINAHINGLEFFDAEIKEIKFLENDRVCMIAQIQGDNVKIPNAKEDIEHSRMECFINKHCCSIDCTDCQESCQIKYPKTYAICCKINESLEEKGITVYWGALNARRFKDIQELYLTLKGELDA